MHEGDLASQAVGSLAWPIDESASSAEETEALMMNEAREAHDDADDDDDDGGGGGGEGHSGGDASKMALDDDPSNRIRESGASGQLKRQLGLLDGVTIIAGLMIGSGIFASPGSVTSNVGSAGMSLIIWVVSGLLALAGALCYAELGTMIPKSGGEFAYFNDVFASSPIGSAVPFLFSWTMALVAKPSTLSIIALVFAQYLLRLGYPEEDSTPVWLTKLVAALCIIVVTAINVFSVSLASRVIRVFTVTKIAIIALLVIAGFVQLAKHPEQSSLHHAFDNTTMDVGQWGLAVVAGLWSYDGWNNLNACVEELRDVSRLLPLAICIAIPLVIICYLLINIAYFSVLSASQVAASHSVAMDMGAIVLGSAGAIIIPICVAISAFGAVNGSAFTGARLVYAAGRDGIFPRYFGKVHGRFTSPHTALVSQAFLACLMLIPGDFDSLVNYFSFAMWIFYLLAVSVLLHLRRVAPHRPRPFKVWLPIPIVFVILAVALVINPLIEFPVQSLACLAFILAGLPFWYWRVRLKREYSDLPGVRFLLARPCCASSNAATRLD